MREERQSGALVNCNLSLGTMGFITFIVFLILKLTGTWDVNWFWVWFPLWAPMALGALFFIVALVVFVILYKHDV